MNSGPNRRRTRLSLASIVALALLSWWGWQWLAPVLDTPELATSANEEESIDDPTTSGASSQGPEAVDPERAAEIRSGEDDLPRARDVEGFGAVEVTVRDTQGALAPGVGVRLIVWSSPKPTSLTRERHTDGHGLARFEDVAVGSPPRHRRSGGGRR